MDDRTERNLKSVHPDLVKIFRKAAIGADPAPTVTSTPRTKKEQAALVAKGASTTMHSRHLPDAKGLVYAIDICFIIGGKMRWDWPLYKSFAARMKKAADELKLPVEWGGDWKTFKDGPHFQLPWAQYPGKY